ncbi:MAG: hypothetical protein GF388_00955 [Candidatus Aegiribacteria sp.]|nr:hypothetical protein [Candidatus Aegiribacteria sp.]MBD3293974.1 hypothetical protein [Candidatus Fermentibacteria bacterium]
MKKMMKRAEILIPVLAAALLISCGGTAEEFDHNGYAVGEGDAALFTRGCQQYFRGSLSRARETFNSLIYRFPDSPLGSDSRLAVRRIEADLSGEYAISPDTSSTARVDFPLVAIVGQPMVYSTVTRLESVVVTTGTPPLTIEDSGAPDVTLVLYPEDMEEQANVVSDSLSGWLSSHSSVPVQTGGDIIASVAPDHTGIVIVVGSDAVVDPQLVQNLTLEP